MVIPTNPTHYFLLPTQYFLLSTPVHSLCYNSQQAANRRRRDAALTKPTRDRSPQEGLAVHAGGSNGNTIHMNVVIERGEGSKVWDVSGNEYVRLRPRLRPDVHRTRSPKGRGSRARARGQELHLLQPDGRSDPPWQRRSAAPCPQRSRCDLPAEGPRQPCSPCARRGRTADGTRFLSSRAATTG